MNSKNLRSLQNARKRFSGFSRLLAECSTEASVYVACVSRKQNITKHVCQQEFQAFKSCTQNAAKKLK